MSGGKIEDAAPRQFVCTRTTARTPVNGSVRHPVLGVAGGARPVPGGAAPVFLVSPATGERLDAIRAPCARTLIVHVRTLTAPITRGAYADEAAGLDSARGTAGSTHGPPRGAPSACGHQQPG